MLFATLALLSAVFASVSATGSDRREGPASLTTAKLVTLANKTPILLTELVSGNTYDFGAHLGYTILAITEGGLNSVEFYVGESSTVISNEEFGAPYYLAGDNGADEVFPSDYLSFCGPKTVRIVGKAGSGAVLFSNTFDFVLSCGCDNDGFECPMGFIATNDCPLTIADCACNSGFQCPTGFAATNSCPLTIADCECNSGFQCPTGFVATNSCPLTIADCECNSGFQCPTGFKPKNSCPLSASDCECNGGFTCPVNSVPKNSCPLSQADCECKPDFYLRGGKCTSCIVPFCDWGKIWSGSSCVPLNIKHRGLRNSEEGRLSRSLTWWTKPTNACTGVHGAYLVKYRSSGTFLDCECTLNRAKNVCTKQCVGTKYVWH